jgi:hypothetical protein
VLGVATPNGKPKKNTPCLGHHLLAESWFTHGSFVLVVESQGEGNGPFTKPQEDKKGKGFSYPRSCLVLNVVSTPSCVGLLSWTLRS